MDYRSLILLPLFLCSSAAFAGYAQLANPAGFSNSAYGNTYAASANDKVFGNVIHQPNGLKVNVPGREIRMPASYRLAANAPRIAAAAIFLHPGVRTAVGIASWLGTTAFVYNAAKGIWEKAVPTVDEFPSNIGYWTALDPSFNGQPTVVHKTAQAACSNAIGKLEALSRLNNGTACAYSSKITIGGVWNGKYSESWSYLDIRQKVFNCPTGTVLTEAGCLVKGVEYVPVPQEEFIRDLPLKPMPETVPQELPYPTPLPVEQPFINPAPGPNPAHQPLFSPTGNPVRNPNFNPDLPVSPSNSPFLQPGIRVVPSPTASSPFQVDLQPVDRPVESGDPAPDPTTDPTEPNPDDKPREDVPDLCQKNPDIIACQKLEQPEELKLPTSEADFNMTPESGFGGAAVCPPPISVHIASHTFQISWQSFCDQLANLRLALLAIAWVSAAFILLGHKS